MKVYRNVSRVLPARATRDGAGVNIRRVVGMHELDPFLMLDEFGSDNPDDYLAGFPEHPHRGFETVTYMLDGYMEHRDSIGNQGKLGPGDVQWMTAGRGIVHSEMPLLENGRMRGFQLWINLPAKDKMCSPRYQEISSADIPQASLAAGQVRIIAGAYGAQTGAVQGIATDPTYLDITLEPGAILEHPVPNGHTCVVYLYEGACAVGAPDSPTALQVSNAALLEVSGLVRLQAAEDTARVLLLAGRPLHETVVQHGPFVMNTQEEIMQAIADYRSGRLTG